MDLGLEGTTALVTAGSSGLGLAAAESLATAGANVAVCGQTNAHLSEAERTLRETGEGGVIALEADITDRGAIEEFVDATVERFGGLDHVVTSAGGPPSGPFLEMSDRDFYDAYDLLVMSVVWTTRAAHPHLAAGSGGSIVNITSRSVKEVIDGLVLSNAVRRAVIGLMKTQADEFAPEIRVNAVLPGAHATSRITDLVDQGVERGDHPDRETGLATWAEGVPTGRVGEPEELGDAVAWLCSEAASYLTGVALPVDGGASRSV
jgi:NAD(P)-dependent dehydrogenase (short-subunit alcohol dehydrogenase family)